MTPEGARQRLVNAGIDPVLAARITEILADTWCQHYSTTVNGSTHWRCDLLEQHVERHLERAEAAMERFEAVVDSMPKA